MDVKQLFDRTPEPAVTARLRALIERLHASLTPWQLAQLRRSDDAIPYAADTLNAVREDATDPARLRERAERFRRADGKPPVRAGADPYGNVAFVVAGAATKPAVASALVWTLLADADEDLASHSVQVIRERAGLPRVTRALRREDVPAAAAAKLPSLIAWFSDRQVADACARIEAVPAAFGPGDSATLENQRASVAQSRAAQPRVTAAIFAGFARRAAAFLVELSVRRLDPIGVPLSRQVQLDADPPGARRLELCDWARRAGHITSPRGAMLVLAIPIEAPWPWRLELIAAEPGFGASGALVVFVRLAGDASPLPPAPAPALLLLPDEPDEERGARFERWLADAYPHATAAWQPWM